MTTILIASIIGIGLAIVAGVIAWIKTQATVDTLFGGRHFG